MSDLAHLTALIEPEVAALGYALVRVVMTGGTSDPTLQVMAERADTRQLSIDDCEKISRRLSDLLDAEDPIEHEYRLEVSSPGIDRPLTRMQDFADWAGHQARIKLKAPQEGRKQFEGVLLGLDGDMIRLDVPKLGETRLPFGAVATAKLLLTDTLIRATAPLSAEGADKINYETAQSDLN
jgi:ribosome maturation factor RimP